MDGQTDRQTDRETDRGTDLIFDRFCCGMKGGMDRSHGYKVIIPLSTRATPRHTKLSNHLSYKVLNPFRHAFQNQVRGRRRQISQCRQNGTDEVTYSRTYCTRASSSPSYCTVPSASSHHTHTHVEGLLVSE